ncbi:MAG: alpha/beta hydrolase [Pirellulales bacterium]
MQKLTAPCLISPWLISLCLALMTSSARAQDSQQTLNSPAPTHANVSYGVHERQVLDFYRARKNTSRAPVLVWIHGGGWVRGDKSPVPHLERLLDRGIAVVSINYRYSWQAQLAKVDPPVSWPISDAVRAIQFIRSKADEWKLDTNRIAASGGSAGACSSLYLAFHADHATPTSADPIERFSSRILFAAVEGAQTSLDPSQLVEWTPNSVYGGHAFGFMDPNDLKTRDTRFAEFLANRSKVEPWIKAYSP